MTVKTFDLGSNIWAEGSVLVDTTGAALGSAANPINTQTPDVKVNGTLTAVSQVLTFAGTLNDISVVTIQVVSGVGTLVPEVSMDGGTTWVSMGPTAVQNVNTGGYSATMSSASVYQVDTAGFSKFRVRVSAFTSALNIYMQGSQATGMVGFDSPIPPGGNTIGNVVPVTPNGSGTTTYHLVSAATTNATNVKAAAGRLYGVTAINTSASPRYIKFFAKVSAPTPGTDVPVKTFLVPASGALTWVNPMGSTLLNGIGFAITGGVGDLDTAAVAAGDIVLDLDYS